MLKKIFWDTVKYFKLIINTKELTRSFLFLLFGLSFIFMDVFGERFDSEHDFIELKAIFYNGQVRTYHTRNQEKQEYYIHLFEYNDDFIISDSYIDYFDRTNFDFFVKSKDPVFIHIAKKDLPNLNTSDNIYVYGISSLRTCYMDYRKAIVNPDDNTTLYIGIILILIGSGMFYYYKGKFII